jgi:phosphoenolpyruvate carboxykinase (GTP)
MADYFQHWLNLGAKLGADVEKTGAKLPGIFCVNWFRKGADGKFVWPGYGDNMRVLEWVVNRVGGEAGAAQGEDHLFGVSPRYDDLRWDGLDFTRAQYASVSSLDKVDWQKELVLHGELFKMLAYHLPVELPAIQLQIEARLEKA